MRIMLRSTHAELLAAAMKVLETKLSAETLCHGFELEGIQDKLQQETSRKNEAQLKLKIMTDLAIAQQATIKMAMQDLVILKGGARIRQAAALPQAAPDPLDPDVAITDEPGDTDTRALALQEAVRGYEEAIAGLDVSRVTSEAIHAAIPGSPEDWRREHAAPSEDIEPVAVPAGD